MYSEQDRKDLKIEALRQKIAELTVQYEDRIADLRVDLTVLSSERDNLVEQIRAYQEPAETNVQEEEPVHVITDLE